MKISISSASSLAAAVTFAAIITPITADAAGPATAEVSPRGLGSVKLANSGTQKPDSNSGYFKSTVDKQVSANAEKVAKQILVSDGKYLVGVQQWLQETEKFCNVPCSGGDSSGTGQGKFDKNKNKKRNTGMESNSKENVGCTRLCTYGIRKAVIGSVNDLVEELDTGRPAQESGQVAALRAQPFSTPTGQIAYNSIVAWSESEEMLQSLGNMFDSPVEDPCDKGCKYPRKLPGQANPDSKPGKTLDPRLQCSNTCQINVYKKTIQLLEDKCQKDIAAYNKATGSNYVEPHHRNSADDTPSKRYYVPGVTDVNPVTGQPF